MEMISEMKIKNKSTNAKCNLETYTLFLLSEPKLVSCVRLSNILENLSHDSINRFLTRSKFSSENLFDTVKQLILLENGILTVDDTVIDKPYSDNLKSELIAYFWSGKHHKVVKGINLITLYYTDIRGVSVPVNYRIVNKNDGKSKVSPQYIGVKSYWGINE
jgi:DDE superfamily endonuclease